MLAAIGVIVVILMILIALHAYWHSEDLPSGKHYYPSEPRFSFDECSRGGEHEWEECEYGLSGAVPSGIFCAKCGEKK